MEEAIGYVLDQPLGLAVLIAVPVAIARGWLVPKQFFQREVDRGNALTETNRIQAETINESTAVLKKLADGQDLTLDVVQRLDERSRRKGTSP